MSAVRHPGGGGCHGTGGVTQPPLSFFFFFPPVASAATSPGSLPPGAAGNASQLQRFSLLGEGRCRSLFSFNPQHACFGPHEQPNLVQPAGQITSGTEPCRILTPRFPRVQPHSDTGTALPRSHSPHPGLGNSGKFNKLKWDYFIEYRISWRRQNKAEKRCINSSR